MSSGKSVDLEGATNYMQTKLDLKDYIKPEKQKKFRRRAAEKRENKLNQIIEDKISELKANINTNLASSGPKRG